jgi:hypothetical protein
MNFLHSNPNADRCKLVSLVVLPTRAGMNFD